MAYRVVAPVEGVTTEGSLPVASGRGLSYREGHPGRHGMLPRGDATGSEGDPGRHGMLPRGEGKPGTEGRRLPNPDGSRYGLGNGTGGTWDRKGME